MEVTLPKLVAWIATVGLAGLAIGGLQTDPTGGSLLVVSAVVAAPPVRRWAAEEGLAISRWAAVALSTGALLAGLWIIGG